ncbi:MAG: aminotransferase class I/II-fold pyridoxal phosphate-dependent enzyme [Acidobacteria bacterium]|nr:aminotransferase class I/II-fold pyridoxal phosphate-dependent enzyme [Acidobacteriota bacterium]
MYATSATKALTDADESARIAAAIDLRSDTVTKPTAAMRRAMAEAEVGDDVYGEDPTVNRLQARAAEIFGREAGLFVPSGSMGNLVAIKIWTRHGNEVICESRGHINVYEMASMSAIAGAMPRTVTAPDGILTWDLIQPLIRPKIYYASQTALVSLESTHNMAGGSVYPPEVAEEICDQAHAAGLPVHLDGARIFNAAVSLGRGVADITRKFDSVMFCLSKGLGAPVGSMLVGSREFIEKARVYRKMFGGGMRQAGVLAAAGLIALEDTPKRLHLDHENARYMAEELAKIPGISIDANKVVSNIVIFGVQGTGRTAAQVCEELGAQKVLANPTGPQTIRMVTHYDVDRAGIDRALEAMRAIVKR